jgi:hypothetical protein
VPEYEESGVRVRVEPKTLPVTLSTGSEVNVYVNESPSLSLALMLTALVMPCKVDWEEIDDKVGGLFAATGVVAVELVSPPQPTSTRLMISRLKYFRLLINFLLYELSNSITE